MKQTITDIVLYQAKSGRIEFRGDLEQDTIWASQKQIAEVFDVDVRTINEHLKNIYKTDELNENSTIRKFRIVRKEGTRDVEREINHYNLDAILSVGYRVNSKQATKFRIWATKTLKQHIINGYTLNKKRIAHNYDKFMAAISNVKAIMSGDSDMRANDLLELINTFAHTWFSLDAYDSERLPENGATKKQVVFTAGELNEAIANFKKELVKKCQATELFAQEKTKNSIEGIVGNVFQSFGDNDLYPTIEEKASHLLYFIVKNHPFTDGNKRSGAFSFVWFLRRAGILRASFSPEALTALTLLVAESKPQDKDRIVGLTLLLLDNS